MNATGPYGTFTRVLGEYKGFKRTETFDVQPAKPAPVKSGSYASAPVGDVVTVTGGEASLRTPSGYNFVSNGSCTDAKLKLPDWANRRAYTFTSCSLFQRSKEADNSGWAVRIDAGDGPNIGYLGGPPAAAVKQFIKPDGGTELTFTSNFAAHGEYYREMSVSSGTDGKLSAENYHTEWVHKGIWPFRIKTLETIATPVEVKAAENGTGIIYENGGKQYTVGWFIPPAHLLQGAPTTKEGLA